MSEAVVAYVVEKLGDLLIEEAKFLYGVEDQFRWLETELKRMCCFLKYADSKQNDEDERVKNWARDIRDVSYVAEDIIDTFILNQWKKYGLVETSWQRRFLKRVKRYICIISELRTHHMVGKQIEQLQKKIKEISISRETYGIRDINDQGRQQEEASSKRKHMKQWRRLSAELLEEPEAVGLQKGIKTVGDMLIMGEPRRCVISLVGMGGSSKTTLAKKVYHVVKKDFDCHAFIYLSQQYAFKDVLKRIIECIPIPSLSREDMVELSDVALGNKLRDHLMEKRYLVVIDNIWSEEAWDTLKLVLLADSGNKRSRVMLTTRIRKVALHADPSSCLHEMRLLDDVEGWELFLKRVFPGGNTLTTCPSELVETGKKIINVEAYR